jgi:hypothetical protein
MKSRYFAINMLLACVLIPTGCSRTPQMGGDEQCMKAADALWTAVTVKQSELLDHSAGEIERLHQEGKMPQEAYESLSGIISTARAGEWSKARAALKTFIRGQRPAAR